MTGVQTCALPISMLRKSSLLVLVFAMALGMLAGCGMKPEDAKAYVQATLDAGYKEDFGEYTKITESTKEEAQKLFDSSPPRNTGASPSRRAATGPCGW